MGDGLALAGQLVPFRHLEEELLLLSNGGFRFHRSCGGFFFSSRGRKRLAAFRIIPVDGHGFHAQLPGFDIGLHGVFDRGLFRHVDGLADRSREEGLHGGHHLQVTVPGNGAPAAGKRQRAIENGKVLSLEARRSFDRALEINMRNDL